MILGNRREINCRFVRGEQGGGQIETAIDRHTANTKTRMRVSLVQKLKRLAYTKDTTQCDAQIKSLSHWAITKEEKELLIKGLDFNVE